MQIDVLEVIRELVSSYSVNMIPFRRDGQDFSDFDMGLRRSFGISLSVDEMLNWIKDNLGQTDVLLVQDFCQIEYCYIRIPEEEQEEYGECLMIGPYQERHLSREEQVEILEKNHMPKEYGPHFSEYLNAVPVILDFNSWREMCKRFAIMIHHAPVSVIYENQTKLDFTMEQRPDVEHFSADLVEKRYKAEEELCRAVLEGNCEEALSASANLARFRLNPRFREPISEIRSILISMNTMLRREMGKAEIHPYYIDRLSGMIARKIDLVYTKNDSMTLRTEMIRKYCLLVQNYSLKGHSEVIQKVVNHINLNLTADLSLHTLADLTSINSSYLSALFKKEMGMTVTNYVNQQRIHYAISLLNNGDLQIQDIAAECGIYDVNYFRRLFRKIIGLSPSEYLREIH